MGRISPRTQEIAKVAEQKLFRRVDLGWVAEFSERNSKKFVFQKFRFETLLCSMPNSFAAVRRANGGHTDY